MSVDQNYKWPKKPNFVPAAPQHPTALAESCEGRRFKPVQLHSSDTGHRTARGEVSIHWTRSDSGGSYTGKSGEQRFVTIPDGTGAWTLFGLDREGKGHVLDVELADEYAAMIRALNYVYEPTVPSVFVWATWFLIVGAAVTLAVSYAPPW